MVSQTNTHQSGSSRRSRRRRPNKTFYVDELEWLLGELGTVRPAPVKETTPVLQERWPADSPPTTKNKISAGDKKKKSPVSPPQASPRRTERVVRETPATVSPVASPVRAPVVRESDPARDAPKSPLLVEATEHVAPLVTASDDEVSECSSLTMSVKEKKAPTAASSLFPPNSTAKVTEVREGSGFSVILADSISAAHDENALLEGAEDGRYVEVALDPREDWGLNLVALHWLQNSARGDKIPLRRVGVLSARPGNGIKPGDRVVSVNGTQVPRSDRFFDVCVDQLRIAKRAKRPVIVGIFRRNDDDDDDERGSSSNEWRWKVIAFERWIGFARDARSGQRLSLAGASCSARALRRRRLLRLRSAFGLLVDRSRRQILIEKCIVRSVTRTTLRSWQQNALELRALDEAAMLATAKIQRRAFLVWQLAARLVKTRRKALARLVARKSLRRWRNGRNYDVQRFATLRNTYLRCARRNALRTWRTHAFQIRAGLALVALSTKREALGGLRKWSTNVRQRAALEALSRRRALRAWRTRILQTRTRIFFASCFRQKTLRALKIWRSNARQLATLDSLYRRRALRTWRASVAQIQSGRTLLALCNKRERLRALRTWRVNVRRSAALEALCRRRALRAWRGCVDTTKATIHFSKLCDVRDARRAMQLWRRRASNLTKLKMLLTRNARRTKGAVWTLWRLETTQSKAARLGASVASALNLLERLLQARSLRIWRDAAFARSTLETALLRRLLRAQRGALSTWKLEAARRKAFEQQQHQRRGMAVASAANVVERAALSQATRTWRENGDRQVKLRAMSSRCARRTMSVILTRWKRQVRLRRLGSIVAATGDRLLRFSSAARALRTWRDFSFARGREIDRTRKLSILGTAIAFSTDSLEGLLLSRAIRSWRHFCVATEFDRVRKLSSLGMAIAVSTKSFERLLLARAVTMWRDSAIQLTKLNRERRLSTLGAVIAASTSSLEVLLLSRALRTWRDSVVELNRQDRQRRLSSLGTVIAVSTCSLENVLRARAFCTWRDRAVELTRLDRERRLFSLGTAVAVSTSSLESLLLTRALRTWRDNAVELSRQDRGRRLSSLGTAIAASTSSMEGLLLTCALRTWRDYVVELNRQDRLRRLSCLGTVIAVSTCSLENVLRARAFCTWRDRAVELTRLDRERRLFSLGTAVAVSTSSLEGLLLARALRTWRDNAVELSRQDRVCRLSSLGTAIAASTSSMEDLLVTRALRTWRDYVVELNRQNRQRRLSSLGTVIAVSTCSLENVLRARAFCTWRDRAVELTKLDRERRLFSLGTVVAVSTSSLESLLLTRALRTWQDRTLELTEKKLDRERRLLTLGIVIAVSTGSLEGLVRSRALRTWRDRAFQLSGEGRERRLACLGTAIATCTSSLEDFMLARALRTWRDHAIDLSRQYRERRLFSLGRVIAFSTSSLEDLQLSRAMSIWRDAVEWSRQDGERRLSSLGTAIAVSTCSLERLLRTRALRTWRDAVELSKRERERRLTTLGAIIAVTTGSMEEAQLFRALRSWQDAVEESKQDRERRLSSLGTFIAFSTSSLERLLRTRAFRTWREWVSKLHRIDSMSSRRARRTKARVLMAWRLDTAQIRATRLGSAISSASRKVERLLLARAVNRWRDYVNTYIDAIELEESISPDRFIVVIARGSEVGPQPQLDDGSSTQSPTSPHRTAVVIARGTDVLKDAELEETTSDVPPANQERSQHDVACCTPTTISTSWLSRAPSEEWGLGVASSHDEELSAMEDLLRYAGSVLSLRHLRPALRRWRRYAAGIEDLRRARVDKLRSTTAPLSNTVECRQALKLWRELISLPIEIAEPHVSMRSDATVATPKAARFPAHIELNAEPSTPPGGLASTIIDLPRSASRADLSRRKERSVRRVSDGDVAAAESKALDGIRSYYSADSFFPRRHHRRADEDSDSDSYAEIEARDEIFAAPAPVDPNWVSMLEKIQAIQRGVAARSSAKMVRAPFDDRDRVQNGVKLPLSWLASPSLGSL